MIERAKSFEIGMPNFGKIKGHTRIELTTVATGEKKIIEHDNVFQSAVLASYMRSLGAYNNNPFTNSTWAGYPLWRNLVGGILLFRDEITAPAEYMPAGNLMVANGAYNVTNSGTPAELGSYNSIESATSGSNSLTFVYDWGTSQGNGTISCICLTSENGGRIGYGNSSGNRWNSGTATDTNQNTQTQNGFPYKSHNYKFTIDATAKTLTVTKRPMATEQASIFNGTEQSSQTYSFSITWGSFDYPCIVYMGGGKAAILPGGAYKGISNGATYSFLIYDFEAKTVTEKTITNNSGKLLAITYNNTCRAALTETSLFALATTNISANMNATDIVEINLATSEATIYTKPQDQSNLRKITPDLIICGNYIADTVNKTVYLINGSDAGQYHDQYDVLVYTPGESNMTNNFARSMHKNPLYLATINNLTNPVTKDSTQTMKVIYTLTEA